MISILMATYNGELYIEEQIQSILKQSYQNYQLIVHDDGSTDNTLNIIRKYADIYKDKIKIIDDGIKTGGPRNNFFHLMGFIDTPYIMFCDQDDIWLPDKIKNAYDKCKEIESRESSDLPVLVFSDLIVTDEKLNVISDSLFKMQKTNSEYAKNINKLVYRNCITGCTVLFNKNALLVSKPFSNDALMHDWWLGLKVLQNNGVIGVVESTDILYRQHNENSVGAKEFTWKRIFKKNIICNIYDKYKQAVACDYQKNIIVFFISSLLVAFFAGFS